MLLGLVIPEAEQQVVALAHLNLLYKYHMKG